MPVLRFTLLKKKFNLIFELSLFRRTEIVSFIAFHLSIQCEKFALADLLTGFAKENIPSYMTKTMDKDF